MAPLLGQNCKSELNKWVQILYPFFLKNYLTTGPGCAIIKSRKRKGEHTMNYTANYYEVHDQDYTEMQELMALLATSDDEEGVGA